MVDLNKNAIMVILLAVFVFAFVCYSLCGGDIVRDLPVFLIGFMTSTLVVFFSECLNKIEVHNMFYLGIYPFFFAAYKNLVAIKTIANQQRQANLLEIEDVRHKLKLIAYFSKYLTDLGYNIIIENHLSFKKEAKEHLNFAENLKKDLSSFDILVQNIVLKYDNINNFNLADFKNEIDESLKKANKCIFKIHRFFIMIREDGRKDVKWREKRNELEKEAQEIVKVLGINPSKCI